MRYRLFYLPLLMLLCAGAYAQAFKRQGSWRVDSLKRALANALYDTVRIRLRYLVGEAAQIDRVSYWDSLQADAGRNNQPLYVIRALAELGYISRYRRDTSIAVDCLEKAMRLAGEKGFKAEMFSIIKRLSNVYNLRGDSRKYLDLNYKGLKMAEEQGNKKAAIDCYSRIATHYLVSHDLTRALEMHLKCLKVCKELNYTSGITDALCDVGSDYHSMGEDKKAVAYYLESGKYVGGLGNTIIAVSAYNSIGSAYEMLQQPDSAYKYSKKAYDMGILLKHTTCIISAKAVMAKAIYQKGDRKKAKAMALEVIEVARSIRHIALIPDIALFLKKIYSEDKNYKAALEAHELYVTMQDSISNDKIRKQAMEKEFSYNYEKKESENKLLAQQNQIQLLQLSRNKYLMLGLAGFSTLVLVIAYLLVRQNRYRSKQKGLHLEQKLLRAQMNPHFIFNSLNAIQEFILKRQNEQAESYLYKFSRLMRELLESNTKESITVTEEAGIINGYIEMESLRFGRSFTFSVTVDEKLDSARINIPHMMIQPFVENAIWHGLLPKKEYRSLQVIFEAHSGRTIKCIVDDNGIGRQASMEKESTFKRKSLALSFVRQRLELMKETLHVNCGVDIIDKKSDNGQSLGTRIVITLPIFQ